jgi:hypothetical protein
MISTPRTISLFIGPLTRLLTQSPSDAVPLGAVGTLLYFPLISGAQLDAEA